MIQDEAIGMLSSVYGNFEELVDFNPAGDGAYGQFFDQGIVYDYEIDGDVVQYQENRSDSEYIADYFWARLDAAGVRCDSDNPYEYWKGYTQTNLDAGGRPNCKNGTVPCGNRCLPRGQKCRMNSPEGGSGRRRKAIGIAIGAGALAAAGAGAAYGVSRMLNRKKAEELKASGEERRKKAEAEFNKTWGESMAKKDPIERRKARRAYEEFVKEAGSQGVDMPSAREMFSPDGGYRGGSRRATGIVDKPRRSGKRRTV